jgi:GTP-binding protein HflX
VIEKKKYNFTAETPEKVVLVGLITPKQDEAKVTEYLDELAFLAATAGAETCRKFTQRLEHPHAKTYIGSGKIDEIKAYIDEQEIGTAIFDDELSPSQLRNLEKTLECKIIDRTNLIFDIFARRAKTAYAKTQVELAQYQYMLPRLTRLWTHLERQRGGKGIGMNGPGETQLETDRRIILDKIAKLKEKLKKLDRQMAAQNRTYT